MKGFGDRLAERMADRGPVCTGIDPHAGLLDTWGLEDSAAGVREFGLRTVDALWEQTAAFKPQSAFFERHGSRGIAALEDVLEACRQAEVPVIADVKRGDIGSTMDGYADAYLSGPLRSDAFTVSPYMGTASLQAAAQRAVEGGQGLFVLALTSNAEGPSIQHVGGPGKSVAGRVMEEVTRWNRTFAPQAAVGPFGVVVGATIGAAATELGIDLAAFPGLFLAPGIGAQGAGSQELREVFGQARSRVLASASRSILRGGPTPAGLEESFARTRDMVLAAVN
ncbi:MAG: orotidine-5'-phosphate decarboxylase [Ancrocorticia sp.]|jgi:orotidine-5'-phosphate decarboxylase|nr:orotidine-5'-phosphate decarboxylase [Ancrocorticia sp.]MCI2198414.1 orotidine-5'-phosphate decarboxylase [Ancrocorticia sp.]